MAGKRKKSAADNSFVKQQPAGNLPRDADPRSAWQGQVTSGHNVQKPVNKHHATSGHSVQKSEYKRQAASGRNVQKPVNELQVTSGHNVQKLENERHATSGHNVQKPENEYHATSGHSVQKSEAEVEREFLQENSFMCDENEGMEETKAGAETDSLPEADFHKRDTYHQPEKKKNYHKRRVQKAHRKGEHGPSVKKIRTEHGDFQSADSAFTQPGEFADKRVEKAADRLERADRRLKKEKDKLPKKTEYYMERVFDEKTGEARYVIVQKEKDKQFPTEHPGKRLMQKLEYEGANFVHGRIAENEKENSAVEGAHKTEQQCEDVYHYIRRHYKGKKQRQAEKIARLEKKKAKAGMEFEREKFLSENPKPDEKIRHRQLQKKLQKQRIKRGYAKAANAGMEAITQKEFQKPVQAVSKAAGKLVETVVQHRKALLVVVVFALILLMIMAGLSSCGSMLSGILTSTMAGTYLSVPAEIDAAELSFTEKEMALQKKIDSIETDHPGYDEYEYNLGEIGHDPFTLISYLSAVHAEFTAEEVESEVQALFDAMYNLSTEEVEETRTRTVTGADGNPVLDENGSEQTEEYTVKIFRTTLVVTPLETIVAGKMDAEQTELFQAYTETKGGLQIFGSPVDYYWYYYISSYYGYRKNPSTGNEELHRGVDIAVPTGTKVYAAHDGTVSEAEYDSYYGNYVVITDSEGYTTKYAHMDSLDVSRGQSVKKGDVIGKSGNTGSSTGSHLHIECLYNGEYYNPLFYFEAGDKMLYGETAGGTGRPAGSGGGGYVIPPESYDDATVRTLMTEANRYVGMPYTFGGTPPASFDCSGFVCWVFTNSGVHNLPRTTAQGIYDQCTPIAPSEAKPGDIIFFTGTYNAGRPVTHVGIYCGNGIMVHCGDPIKYSSINTSYWQSHFYGFGRLN